MKIEGIAQLQDPQRAKAVEGNAAEETPKAKDRVSVAASKGVQVAIAAARDSMGGARAARLEQLTAQVKSGGYKPDPAQVANQILSDAEVEARIQAMLNPS
jgi:anti-sigma28 factor (negative regulator of flagellin synthesis)